MKKFFSGLVVFCALAGNVAAQAPQLGCINPDTRLLADEVKQHFKAQGFAVVRDAMVGMSSHQPFSAVVELVGRQNYRIVFVADKRASFMDVEVINTLEKQIVYEKFKPKRDASRVIEFPFTQPASEALLFILKQNVRPDEACGSFTILRDTVASRKMMVKPY